jgi:hypothetical protein
MITYRTHSRKPTGLDSISSSLIIATFIIVFILFMPQRAGGHAGKPRQAPRGPLEHRAYIRRRSAADAKNRITDAISTERIRVENESHRARVEAWNGEGLAPPSVRSR